MFPTTPKNASLENKIKKYLKESYYTGYDLDEYFTEENQKMMFEKLLNCDEEFRQKWESGSYCEPEVPSETMYLSSYITKHSYTKKIFRKCSPYKINKKLTKGAKNLLKGYMIEYSQNQTISLNDKLSQIFCGILQQSYNRREQYISQIGERTKEPVLSEEIRSYIRPPNGGKKSKRRFKRKPFVNKNKTNKRKYKRRVLKVHN